MTPSALTARQALLDDLIEQSLQGHLPPQRSLEPDPATPDPDLAYFHITSRSHLRTFYLQQDRPKEILAELCLHYARLYHVSLLDYCFMDNHFHLIVAIERHRADLLSKFVGCIKQQFTREYKFWFNHTYRPSNKYRDKKLERGTLWDGPALTIELDDFSYLAACTLYVENNRIVTEQHEEEPSLEDLINALKASPHQSARWYLGGRQGHDPCLTDGTDGVWATREELDTYWTLPKRSLPQGWRKVWSKDSPGILKPPPPSQRRYASHPFIQSLASSPDDQATELARLLQMAYRRTRRETMADAA